MNWQDYSNREKQSARGEFEGRSRLGRRTVRIELGGRGRAPIREVDFGWALSGRLVNCFFLELVLLVLVICPIHFSMKNAKQSNS